MVAVGSDLSQGGQPAPAQAVHAGARWQVGGDHSGRRRSQLHASGREDEGAKVALGGSGRPYDRGWYVTPTVFSGVDNDMRIAREEIFGPVLAVIPYDDEADAVRIANDSEYGLAGTVWTADADHGLDIARQVRTGTYGVNTYMIESSSPFGGYKSSGVGRELGPEGLSAYLEYKSIARLG